MKSLLLRLEGPLQSWGVQGKFGIRDTEREPSKSGVVGLLGAALGMARSDETTLARLRALAMAVRVDVEGRVMSDYHTVGGGTFNGTEHGVWPDGKTALTTRYYLGGASFLVGMASSDPAWVDRLGDAVQNPRFPLVLGRRCCPPASPIFVGVVEGDAETAVRSAPNAPLGKPLRFLVEDASGTKASDDVPLSFVSHSRAFGRRRIREFHEVIGSASS